MGIRRILSSGVAQAWIEPVSDDPEALSALAVARAHLPEGRSLNSLRRMRLLELRGSLPGREQVTELLHRSAQFYNPHKERCTLRLAASDPAPVRPDEHAVLVVERDGARRTAAERWWLHETGERVEVREGTAWVLAFEAGRDPGSDAEALAWLRGRRQGLLCNPHSQECRLAGREVPVPWLDGNQAAGSTTRGSGGTRRDG